MEAPGPDLIEILSKLPLIVGDRLQWMTEVQKQYGDVVRVPLGPRTLFGVFHPDHIHHVLVANAKNYWKGRTFQKTAGYIGNGLVTAELGVGGLSQLRNRHCGRLEEEGSTNLLQLDE